MSAPLDTLLRPLMRLWLAGAQSALSSVPRPNDAPYRHARGADVCRILVMGSGPAAGWGVRSHDLALPGHLARAITGLTGRGTDVRVLADTVATPETVRRAAHRRNLLDYDGLVLTTGPEAAIDLTTPERWRGLVSQVIRDLEAATSPTAACLLTGITSVRAIPLYDSLAGALAQRRALILIRITAEVCAQSARTSYLELPTPGENGLGRLSAAIYRTWAEAIAIPLAARLTNEDGRAPVRSRPISGPQEESARLAALTRLGDVATDPAVGFDRIVRFASEAFGTASAAFTLVGDERQWHKAQVGAAPGELPRSGTLFDRTIQSEGALVVGDASGDARLSGDLPSAGTEGVRFYAGFPVRSPDGYRVGVLSVFDPAPRSEADVDVSLLRDLARLAERELWDDLHGIGA